MPKAMLVLARSVVLLLLTVAACGGGTSDRRKFSEQAEKTADKLRKEIQAEVQTLKDHPWAGEYYCGDGLGMNVSLIIAPKRGYVFAWHGCLGLYDRNYGAVTETNGGIRLAFTFENKKKDEFVGIAEEFIPVAWGRRRYLIASNEVVRFCNEVNAGSEPRTDLHGFHLLRCGDEDQKVTGFPTVPDRYRPYLLKSPITVEIVAVGSPRSRDGVGEWKFKDTPVTINAGEKHGVRVGMKFHVTSPDHAWESVDIVKVEKEKSEGIMTQMGRISPSPEVGWRLSTRLPWRPAQDSEQMKK